MLAPATSPENANVPIHRYVKPIPCQLSKALHFDSGMLEAVYASARAGQRLLVTALDEVVLGTLLRQVLDLLLCLPGLLGSCLAADASSYHPQCSKDNCSQEQQALGMAVKLGGKCFLAVVVGLFDLLDLRGGSRMLHSQPDLKLSESRSSRSMQLGHTKEKPRLSSICLDTCTIDSMELVTCCGAPRPAQTSAPPCVECEAAAPGCPWSANFRSRAHT